MSNPTPQPPQNTAPHLTVEELLDATDQDYELDAAAAEEEVFGEPTMDAAPSIDTVESADPLQPVAPLTSRPLAVPVTAATQPGATEAEISSRSVRIAIDRAADVLRELRGEQP